jgi:UPF0755 protein
VNDGATPWPPPPGNQSTRQPSPPTPPRDTAGSESAVDSPPTGPADDAVETGELPGHDADAHTDAEFGGSPSPDPTAEFAGSGPPEFDRPGSAESPVDSPRRGRRAMVGERPPDDTGPVGGAVAAAPVPGTPAPDRRRERRRRRRLGCLALVVVPLLVVLVPVGWFVWELHPPGGAGHTVTVDIRPGWGKREAGDELQRRGVIGSSVAFQIWTRLHGTSFEAGTYRMPTHLGVGDAADRLARGPAALPHNTLLLPPGLRLDQIAARVGKLPGHDANAFLALARSGAIRSQFQGNQASIEGFTWPDTYFVSEHETDADIIRTLVTAFDRHAVAAGLTTTPANGLSPQQTVAVASLVQAEGSAADAPNIAAVIVNRLRRGIPLQIDATLCYAKGGCPPVPSGADKNLASPYNTYQVTGLPPTPIMTITDDALRAAIRPATVPYLYYVTGKDGVTRFATTFAEQQQNIQKYGVRGE